MAPILLWELDRVAPSPVGSKHGLSRRLRDESRHGDGRRLNTSALAVGILSLLLAVAWLPLTRRDQPPRFVPRMQRWGTYGEGARALVVIWLIGGIGIILFGLATRQ